VSAVAVGADRSFLGSGSDRVSMHTLLVRSDHLRALPAVLHYEFLAVADPACAGNIGVMHARFRIAGWQQFVRAAVAVDATRRFAISFAHRLAVETAVICRLLIGVTSCAGDFQRSGLVRRALNIRVAIHAGEHAAVDGILEALRIHVQADRFAVYLVRQGGIAMAGHALFCGRFGGFLAGGWLSGCEDASGS
jgi:hypothetical protein